MSVSYNKLSSIQIGGTYVNYVPIGARGNVSLDCSGNSLFRGATFMDASLNVSGIFNVGGDVSMNSKLFVGGDVSMNSKLRVAGDVSMNSNLFVGGDVSMNSKLRVASDVSMNSNLFVGGDVSFNQNLYTIGNTSTKSLTINDAYPTPIKTAQIGFDVAKPITTILTTGTTSNVTIGTAFKPISIVIPAGNASNVAYVEVPLNLFGSRASGSSSGTLTLTYTDVSMNIYRNGSLQSATGQSITPVQFTGGDTKQGMFNFASGGTPLYLGYYFGYFNIQFPIFQFNTSADTYEIELIITASANNGFILSIASSGGSMGYGVVSPVIPFTQTRVKSANSASMVYVTATTTPFNPVDVQVQYDYGLKMISDTDFLISAIGELNLKTNQQFNITSTIGGSSMTSDGGSIEISAPNGFWTARTSENMYLKTTGTNSQILFGNATTDWVGLDTDATQFNINTYSKPFYINSNGLTQTITGNFETDATGDINLTATDVLITTTGTSVGEFVVRANTNVDIATTTGNIELFANTTMLLKSGGTNTLEVDGNNKMVTSSTTTTINNTNHVINANTSVNVDNTFNMMPTATIIQNVSATVPAGFLYCNGQAVNRTGTYARLFAAIGTTFGVGNGSTTFNVPNFKGAFLRGREDQTVSSVNYASAALGTAQQDAVLTPLTASNQGYYNLSSGSARQCVARTIQTGDPVDTGTGILPRFDRTAGENRPFNYAVFYYIRF